MDRIAELSSNDRETLRKYIEFTACDDPLIAYSCLEKHKWNLNLALESFLSHGCENDESEDFYPTPFAENLTSPRNEYLEDYQAEKREQWNEKWEIRSVDPLISNEAEDLDDALNMFETNFKTQYCSDPVCQVPPFSKTSLQELIDGGFEKRPILFFITHQESENSEKFNKNVMCNETVCDLINRKFVLFPWDFTEGVNITRLQAMLEETNLSEIFGRFNNTLMASVQLFPMLAVVGHFKNTVKIIGTCHSTESADEVLGNLSKMLREFETERETDKRRKIKARNDSLLIKRQNDELEKSLHADLEKMTLKIDDLNNNDPNSKDEAQLVKPKPVEMNLAKPKTMASELMAEEPDENDPNSISIKFRLPDNTQVLRRFLNTDPIQSIFDFLATMRFTDANSRVFNSANPRKEISKEFSPDFSFVEVNWPAKEVLFVQEI